MRPVLARVGVEPGNEIIASLLASALKKMKRMRYQNVLDSPRMQKKSPLVLIDSPSVM